MSFTFLATEDALSEAVGLKIIRCVLGDEIDVKPLTLGGFGNLKAKMPSFVDIARRNFVFLMTDLDQAECVPSLRNVWFKNLSQPEGFCFRVAVREVESWVMADRENFADFLGVSVARITPGVEALQDPKRHLIKLAGRAQRHVRTEIVPSKGSRAVQGVGYNSTLCRFVNDHWECIKAAENSDSLCRAIRSVENISAKITGEANA